MEQKLHAQGFIDTIKELSELNAELMLQKNMLKHDLKIANDRIKELEEDE